MIWYAIPSLTPAALLALACVLGGLWPLAALMSITVVVFFADKLGKALPEQDKTGRALSIALAVVHFGLLGLAIWALGAGTHLSVLDKILVFMTAGLFFGQISNSNAHELIHAASRFPRRLGALVYASLLHGHHVSAHLRVHHIYAATSLDPNSARMGEGFWAFAGRALRGEFVAGYQAEQKHRARATAKLPVWSHPYLWYVSGGAFTLVVAFLSAGWGGLIAHLGIALYAQLQLLLSDYVQHYGLQRAITDSGKPAPIGPQHSWNAPKWYSSAMMLNAPRHSDHHIHPTRPYPALEVTPEGMPVLPHSLPVMAVLALFPPFWHRVMDRRVQRWQNAA
jgi:alkane 1-monooxygenase